MMTMKQIVAFEKSMDEIYVCFLKNISLTVSVIKRAMQRFSWFVLSIFYISVMFSPLKQRVPLKALRRKIKLWYTLWSIILKQSILIQILANHICPCSFKDVADLFLNHKLGFNCILVWKGFRVVHRDTCNCHLYLASSCCCWYSWQILFLYLERAINIECGLEFFIENIS